MSLSWTSPTSALANMSMMELERSLYADMSGIRAKWYRLRAAEWHARTVPKWLSHRIITTAATNTNFEYVFLCFFICWMNKKINLPPQWLTPHRQIPFAINIQRFLLKSLLLTDWLTNWCGENALTSLFAPAPSSTAEGDDADDANEHELQLW